MIEPALSVVVPSHERPLRLRWLLNALHEQTLDRSLWEVVVCHDSRHPATERLLATHPLSEAGSLRWTRLPPGSALPGANRNAALRLVRAPAVVFTDDDCRPPPDWLEHVLAAVDENPAAIVQGPVQPDPDEAAMLRSPHPRSQSFTDVPRPWAECCNIVYPRSLLAAVGGFAEDVATGEDVDLNCRARAAGARYVGDGRMLTYHAVEEGTALGALRGIWRWGDLAALVKRHPALRSELHLRVFWKPTHGAVLLALGGVIAAWQSPFWLGLTAPWIALHRSGRAGTRGTVRDVIELPGSAAIDFVEVLALVRGSVRHRSLIL